MKNLLSAPLEFLNDFHGGKSSKRFWGNRLLTIGVMLKLNLYSMLILAPLFFDKQFPQATFDNCDTVTNQFIYLGAGLLFSAMAERLQWMKK